MSTLIRNGRIITAADDYVADILIEGETISRIGKGLSVSVEHVIDAADRLVIPGGIDPHVHMQLPFGGTISSDDFPTGTRAAAAGGTTTIIDFAIQSKGEALHKTLANWHAKADGRCAIDYGFHLAITDFSPEREAELAAVIEAGVTSFKLFMAYPDVFMVDDRAMYRVMKTAAAVGGLTMVHAESGLVIDERIKELIAEGHTGPRYHAASRPSVTEIDGVERALRIAELADSPVFIVHVSTAGGVAAIARARAAGVQAFGETCTQYLFLDESEYQRPGFEAAKYVFTPPLRSRDNIEPLWSALSRGELQEISTDHCPFNFVGQKDLGRDDFRLIPNGGPGVEDRLIMAYEGAVVRRKFSLNKWVELTSTASAKMFGMFPKKGTIAVGSDADVVIFDPSAVGTRSAANQQTRCDYNLYEGMVVHGRVEGVLSRGTPLVDGGKWVGPIDGGQYVRRAKFHLQ